MSWHCDGCKKERSWEEEIIYGDQDDDQPQPRRFCSWDCLDEHGGRAEPTVRTKD